MDVKLAREMGKPLADAMGEAGRAGAIFKYFAGEAVRIRGDKLDSVRPGVEVDVTREPVGVVGFITPWNFPLEGSRRGKLPRRSQLPTAWSSSQRTGPRLAVDPRRHSAARRASGGVLNLVVGPGSKIGPTIPRRRTSMR